jgi:hypothetical protein
MLTPNIGTGKGLTCGPSLDCIMRWINLLVVGGMVLNKSYHAVD